MFVKRIVGIVWVEKVVCLMPSSSEKSGEQLSSRFTGLRVFCKVSSVSRNETMRSLYLLNGAHQITYMFMGKTSGSQTFVNRARVIEPTVFVKILGTNCDVQQMFQLTLTPLEP